MAQKNRLAERRNTYTIFDSDNVKWHWDMNKVWEFDERVNNGENLLDVAKCFKISYDDAVLLACDRIKKGKITKGLKVTLV